MFASIPFSKILIGLFSVFKDTSWQVRGYACVKSSISFVGYNIDSRLFHTNKAITLPKKNPWDFCGFCLKTGSPPEALPPPGG
jgi:hypothetical protein